MCQNAIFSKSIQKDNTKWDDEGRKKMHLILHSNMSELSLILMQCYNIPEINEMAFLLNKISAI